ncbi:MAG TPA: hypothetical protein VKB93_23810 [Thermoanaerobaculia bacterium]|nr:hypothetical protein [Thermoanaerobaculia bacterium]
MAIPARLLGYGAYNLANDRYMGKPASGTGPIFFKYLRDSGYPVNLVKLIVFRYSGEDDLNLFPARQVSLYTPQRAINTTYIDQLVNTVDQARQFGFWVQVCLFSYHSVAAGEQPEHAPTVFNLPEPTKPPTKPSDPPGNVRLFFNAADTARFNEQARLVRAIVDRLRVFPNVLWELANELRVKEQPENPDNCQLVAWLIRMRGEIVRAAQGAPVYIGTSSGIQNERYFFKRMGADACTSPALQVEFFDFHSGQWSAGIGAAKNRVRNDYGSSAPLIINDDGLKGAASSTQIRAWAAEAFRNNLHYAAKQTYPPAQPWNNDVLDRLKEAWNNPNGF